MAMNKKGTTRELRTFLLPSSGYRTLPVRDDRSNISTASSDWLLTNVGRCLIIPKLDNNIYPWFIGELPVFWKNIPIDDWLIFQHLPIYELVLFPTIFPFFLAILIPNPGVSPLGCSWYRVIQGRMSASLVLGFCQDEATRAAGSSARESSLSFYPLKLGLVSVAAEAAEAAEKKQPLDFIDVEHQPFVAFFFSGVLQLWIFPGFPRPCKRLPGKYSKMWDRIYIYIYHI